MKPKVKISRDKMSQDIGTLHANGLVAQAAELLAPFNIKAKYKTSCVVHVYEDSDPISSHHQTFFICQTIGLKNIPEPMASAAVAELAKQMMLAYGRKIPESRE